MKIIVAGSRSFNDFNMVINMVGSFIKSVFPPPSEVTIVSGTAKGADQLGEQYAKLMDYNLMRFPADWKEHGKAAGYIRNKEMAEHADALIAFWDGVSKGTRHMIDIFARTDKPYIVIRIPDDYNK